MEFLRTSLASRTPSRTHFQVLGLRLEASSPPKLPCPRLFFEWLKFCRSAEKCFFSPFFFWRSTEKKILRPFFLGKHLHLCPWSLASDFFVSLASSLVSSTPPLGQAPPSKILVMRLHILQVVPYLFLF